MAQATPAACEQQEISYGAAFFDFPPAPNCANPEQVADELWRALFITQQAGSAARTGLFSSCRTGRDWVLREAPNAALRVDTAASEPREQWLARLAAVQQALVTRGAAPTAVALVCGADVDPVRDILQHLQAAPAGISDLTLTFTAACDQGALAALVGDAGSALPNLSTLNLTACPLAIPPPEQLASVKHLHLILKVADWGEFEVNEEVLLYVRLRGYMRQLTSLTITRKEAASETHDLSVMMYVSLFGPTLDSNGPSPPNITHALTHISVNTALDYNLLHVFLEYVPNLTHLCVTSVRLYMGYHTDKEWGLKELKMTNCLFLLVEEMAGLPRSPAGSRVDIVFASRHGELVADAALLVDKEGIPFCVCRHLCEWRLHVKRLFVMPTPNLPATTHPSAISAALGQVGALQAPGAVTHIVGWHGTPELLHGIAAALAPLSHLCPALRIHEPIVDWVLSIMLQMGSIQMHVGSLALTTAEHGDALWPWVELCLEHPVSVYDIPKLPTPAPGTRAVLRCNKVLLYPLGDFEVPSVEPVMDGLPHMEWDAYRDNLRIVVSGPTANPPHPYTDFPTQLGLLAAMQLRKGGTESNTTVVIRAWPMSPDNMAALSSLPAWKARLDLTQCGFPLEPTEYKRLAEHVPTTYTSWVLPGLPESPLVQSVCAGLNERRQGLGLSRVYVVCPESEGEDREVGEHVMVRGKQG